MNVFILCTGRCGSMSISKACNELDHYTSGHETRISLLGDERINYPLNHIEADNRLAWFLGRLDDKYGKDAFYVHMTRDTLETAKSYNRRWNHVGSIVRSYTEGILAKPLQRLSSKELLNYSEDYCNTLNENILHFLKDKDKKCTIRLEYLESDFLNFLDLIDVKSNRENALLALNEKHNSSRTRNSDLSYKVKLFLIGLKNKFITTN
jgi:hypothetical protein